MKKNCHHKPLVIALFLLGISVGNIYAQDNEAPAPVLLSLQYFLPENNVPYIKVITKQKTGRKFEPVKGVTLHVYLSAVAEKNLLGNVTTGTTGEARLAFPASIKASWDSLDEFTIVAESVPAAKEEALTADLTVKKAILVLDTASEDGERKVSAQLKEKNGNNWVAVKDVEMKLKIKRLGGNLSVGDDETYTADTSGTATAPFLKDSMPGDEKGNLILVARVEDNDTYGNLVVEKTVPWGKAVKSGSNFWHRTLWSTGNRAPIWLITIAVSIILGVWGTLFYLVRQVFKIKKMGRMYEKSLSS